ncbi:Ig-like domain repeat protein [Aquihabitans daechungensis]|uniref:Ig-like domain repeat protein n=1 Tax=Aquihabitans daechungensis TaxID=1052257 RepID=UPI003BA06E64
MVRTPDSGPNHPEVDVKRRIPQIATLALALVAGLAAVDGGAAALPGTADGGPAELLRYVGDPSSATGAALANGECDVNGDGDDDLVVGAWFWDKAPTSNIGATYVLLGGSDVRSASLADPADAGAVRIDGPATAGAFTGFAVACVGDVNGDDLDDLAISHYTAQKTYVVFGAQDFTGLALDSIGDRGFTVLGGPTSGNVGFSMSPVGDLNADGLADFAVAEVAADTQGRTNNGRVWVVAGRDEISDVDLLNPTAGQLVMTVDGAISEERVGNVARVGDVNGDGVDDFLLGAYTSTPWGAGVAVPGAAYVVFGGSGATGEIDTANLGSRGFTIVGPTRQRDRLGISVSAAGDLNADGKADLLIGADGVANAATGPRNGGAAVVFGSAATDRVYTDPAAASGQSVFTCEGTVTDPGSCPAPVRRGYWIDGAVAGDSTGYSVAGIGDVNGDDVPDLALGAYGFDPANPAGGTFSGAGAAYVVFGAPGAVTQSLASLPAAGGYRIDGTAAGDRFGRQVGLIGDFDGNGVRDLAVGADFAARGGAQNGEVTVALFGRLDATVTLDGPQDARPGDAVTFTAAVTKAVGDQTPLAGGTVDFALGGTPIAGCGDVAVTGGSASCTAAFASEVSGDVVATYSGTDAVEGASSPAAPFAVVKTVTATTLLVSEETPATGQVVQLLARVAAGEADVASGKVAFTSAGTPIPGCGSVTVVDGYASCSTSWSTRGSRAVVAAYQGTSQIAASASAPTTVVAGTDVAIRPVDGAGTYGVKGATLTGEVQGSGRTPTGTVTLKAGATVLGTSTLSGGRYTVALGTNALVAGNRALTVEYGGDSRHHPATASTTAVIRRGAATTAITVTPANPRIGTRAVVSVAVTAKGTVPTGDVRVQLNSKTIVTVRLDSSGKATVTLPAFGSKGSKGIRAYYLGSNKVAPAYSATKIVVVR